MAASSVPLVRPLSASRILGVTRHTPPSTLPYAATLPPASASEADLEGDGSPAGQTGGGASAKAELQRLLELSRITQEMQRIQQAELEERMEAFHSTMPGLRASSSEALLADGCRYSEEMRPVHDGPKQSRENHFVTHAQDAKHGKLAHPPRMMGSSQTNGCSLPTSAIGHSIDGETSPMARLQPQPNAQAAQEEGDRAMFEAGASPSVDEFEEDDSAWEETLRAHLDKQLQTAEAEWRRAERRATASQQSLWRTRREWAKGAKQLNAEVAQAKECLEAAKQRAGSSSRVAARDSTSRVEAELDVLKEEMAEEQRLMELSEARASSCLQELRDSCTAEALELESSVEQLAGLTSQHSEIDDVLQVQMVSIASERRNVEQQRAALEAAELALVPRLPCNPQEETSALQPTDAAGNALREQRLDLDSRLVLVKRHSLELEANVRRLLADVTHGEASLSGFRDALHLGVEVAEKWLAEEAADLQQEERMAQRSLERVVGIDRCATPREVGVDSVLTSEHSPIMPDASAQAAQDALRARQGLLQGSRRCEDDTTGRLTEAMRRPHAASPPDLLPWDSCFLGGPAGPACPSRPPRPGVPQTGTSGRCSPEDMALAEERERHRLEVDAAGQRECESCIASTLALWRVQLRRWTVELELWWTLEQCAVRAGFCPNAAPPAAARARRRRAAARAGTVRTAALSLPGRLAAGTAQTSVQASAAQPLTLSSTAVDEADADHRAHVEALQLLDAGLREEAALQQQLEGTVSEHLAWRRCGKQEAAAQVDLARQATAQSSRGRTLQDVYAGRAREVDRLVLLQEAILEERREFEVGIASVHGLAHQAEESLKELCWRRTEEAVSAQASSANLHETQRMLAGRVRI